MLHLLVYETLRLRHSPSFPVMRYPLKDFRLLSPEAIPNLFCIGFENCSLFRYDTGQAALLNNNDKKTIIL